MSALGDYVHLYVSNYKEFGTAQKGFKKEPFSASYAAQKAKYKERLSSLKIPSTQAIEELKTRIRNENNQKTAMELAHSKQVYNSSLENLTEQMVESLKDAVSKKFSSDGSGIILNDNIITDSSEINIKEAKKLKTSLTKKIEKINKNNSASDKDIEELNTLFTDFFKTLGIVNKNLVISYGDLTNKSTTAALQNIVDMAVLSELNKATLHGTFGEVLVNMVCDTLENQTKEALQEEVIKKLQTGENRTPFALDSSLIPKNVNTSYKKQTKNSLYRIHKTQDKVDAEITILQEDIKASVKAYTPASKNIARAHLQDVNLIYNLATTQEQFGNHWLNIHALDGAPNKKKVDKELANHIKYEALSSGNLLKKGKAQHADTFIAIDAIEGRVFVKTVPDLLKDKYSSMFKLTPDIASIRLSNKKEDTWENRIAKMLIELHQQKISVSLAVDFSRE